MNARTTPVSSTPYVPTDRIAPRNSQQLNELRLENARLLRVISELALENLQLREALQEAAETLRQTAGRLERSGRTEGGVKTSEKAELQLVSEEDVEAAPPQEPHVVEETHFRFRRICILSDGTIEADTPGGRMRFEDLQHLEEHFDEKWPLAGS